MSRLLHFCFYKCEKGAKIYGKFKIPHLKLGKEANFVMKMLNFLSVSIFEVRTNINRLKLFLERKLLAFSLRKNIHGMDIYVTCGLVVMNMICMYLEQIKIPKNSLNNIDKNLKILFNFPS